MGQALGAVPIRVLIVEDNRGISGNIAAYLGKHSYVMDFAYDGTSAMHLALTNPFDVIVLDLMLPGMDGLSFCRKLRTESEVETPVLMLTAKCDDRDYVRGGYRRGGSSYDRDAARDYDRGFERDRGYEQGYDRGYGARRGEGRDREYDRERGYDRSRHEHDRDMERSWAPGRDYDRGFDRDRGYDPDERGRGYDRGGRTFDEASRRRSEDEERWWRRDEDRVRMSPQDHYRDEPRGGYRPQRYMENRSAPSRTRSRMRDDAGLSREGGDDWSDREGRVNHLRNANVW